MEKMCVWEKNINSLEITVIIFKEYKKSKSAELFTKTSFFPLETVLKMAKETNKRDIKSLMCKSN